MNKPKWLTAGLLIQYTPENVFFHAAYLGQDDTGALYVGADKATAVPVADCRPGITNSLYRTPNGDMVIQPHESGVPGTVVALPVGMGQRRFVVQAAEGVDYAAAKIAAAFDGVVISEVAA